MEKRGSTVKVEGKTYLRIPVKTNVITKNSSLEYLLNHSLDFLQKKDTVFISEKVISIIQGRIIHLDDINPGFLAKMLSKHVSKTPGSNLTDPRAMEVAIQEAGYFKIILAAGLSAITKPFNIKGVFYKVAGDDVRGIDMPERETVKGFNKYISLSPLNPDKVAAESKNYLGCDVCILDANYRGVNILASSNKELDYDKYVKILKDNPMGQKDEQTPICIVREI